MVRAKTCKILSFALLCFVFALLLPAQQQTGSMIGTVVDPSGSNVPGAEVVVKNTGTSATFTAVTDGTGLGEHRNSIPASTMFPYQPRVSAPLSALALQCGLPTVSVSISICRWAR